MAQHLRDNSHIASRFGQEQAQVPQPHLHLEQLRGHNDGLSPARDRSISPGVESHMTHGSTLGEGEKVILNSVIARLQHGIDHAGRSRDGLPRGPGGMNVASPPHTDVTGVTPQSVELRQQLDRAGILIGQQLETSARKDILMEQLEGFASLEKLHLQIQLESMYDHLSNEREHFYVTEQQLHKKMEKMRKVHASDRSGEEKAQADYEERMAAMALAHQEAIEELMRKGDEARKETRHELQEAAERLSEAISQSEKERREERQAGDEGRELEFLEREELEARYAIVLEVLEESYHVHVVTDVREADPADAAGGDAEGGGGAGDAQAEEEEVVDGAEGGGVEEEDGAVPPAELIASLQQEVESLRSQLNEALEERERGDEETQQLYEEKQRLGELVGTLEGSIEEVKSDYEMKALELEGQMIVLGNNTGSVSSGVGGEGRVVVNVTQESSIYLEELIQTQQDAGRYFIMLQQLQELLCFVLQRYAPHWGSGEEGGADGAVADGSGGLFLEGGTEDEQQTKYRGIYPSYWGWLYKSTGMFVSWQRRFFVLRDGVIKMGVSGEIGMEAEWGNPGAFKTVLRVESIAKVELESFKDSTQGNHPPTGKYESFGFSVETYSRQRIKFCCTSSSERAEWMAMLRRCNEIRLNNERFKACNCEGEPSAEPFLYLEYASPPDPPPTYRTRVRLQDCGAYPMVGPGSPPRAHLQGIPQWQQPASPAQQPPSSQKARRDAREHQSPPPPRPVLIQGDKPAPRGARARNQLGGASGVGRQHRSDEASSVTRSERRGHGAASQQQSGGGGGGGVGTPTATPQHGPVTPMKKLPRRASATKTPPVATVSPASMQSASEATGAGDPFEGTVPLDVLLVKASGDDEQSEEEEAQTRATAHAFFARFRGSYEKVQIYYSGQDRGCVLASAIYTEVLGTPDSPTLIQSEVPGLLTMLNNMAAQPAVAGSPSSLLTILITPDYDSGNGAVADLLDYRLSPGTQEEEVIPAYTAVLYSSLYAAHRSGVSWERVTRIDGK